MKSERGVLNRDELRALAEAEGEQLVSIFLPTHRAGAEVRADRIRLKNLVAEAVRQADARGQSEKTERLLEPATRLDQDPEFWNHQDLGLAIFGTPGDELTIRRLPYEVPEFAHVGDHFAVRPLLQPGTESARFLLLSLSQHGVHLYDCTRESCDEISLEGGPTSLPDAVGHDYEEKSLQFHTGTADRGPGKRPAVFHGQGRSNEEHSDELQQFVKRLDTHIASKLDGRPLGGARPPMLIAATERVAAAFRHTTHYPSLMDAFLNGSPEHRSARELHAEALEVLRDHHANEHEARLRQIGELIGAGKATADEAEVLRAAREGRVQTLAVRTQAPLWGEVEGDRVQFHEKRTDSSRDLADLAARHALRTGAEVIAADGGTLLDGRPMAAALRF